MSRKKKIIIQTILFFAEIACAFLFLWFLLEDYKILKFVPLAVAGVIIVVQVWLRFYNDEEPEEWYGNINVTEEHDE